MGISTGDVWTLFKALCQRAADAEVKGPRRVLKPFACQLQLRRYAAPGDRYRWKWRNRHGGVRVWLYEVQVLSDFSANNILSPSMEGRQGVSASQFLSKHETTRCNYEPLWFNKYLFVLVLFVCSFLASSLTCFLCCFCLVPLMIFAIFCS